MQSCYWFKEIRNQNFHNAKQCDFYQILFLWTIISITIACHPITTDNLNFPLGTFLSKSAQLWTLILFESRLIQVLIAVLLHKTGLWHSDTSGDTNSPQISDSMELSHLPTSQFLCGHLWSLSKGCSPGSQQCFIFIVSFLPAYTMP